MAEGTTAYSRQELLGAEEEQLQGRRAEEVAEVVEVEVASTS